MSKPSQDPIKCITFELGNRMYGKLGKLSIRGEIPIIGKYERPNMVNAPATQAFFEKTLRELCIPWKEGEEERATGPDGWIRTAITACAYGIPSLDLSSSRMRGFICFNLGNILATYFWT
jgi:hypothetical protein